jgi:hypothetical protein
MKKYLLFWIVAGALFVPAAASVSEAKDIARFDGGIGVIPAGSANTTVRGVPPAGQIWVIRDLRADVRPDGMIRVDGKGLLLGAGNNFAGDGLPAEFPGDDIGPSRTAMEGGKNGSRTK